MKLLVTALAATPEPTGLGVYAEMVGRYLAGSAGTTVVAYSPSSLDGTAAITLVGIVLTRTLWVRADSPPAASYGVALAAVALVGYQFDQNFLRLDFWFLMAQGLALARSA